MVDLSRQRTVYIYRVGQKDADERVAITRLVGEGPVAGFELDLTDILDRVVVSDRQETLKIFDAHPLADEKSAE